MICLLCFILITDWVDSFTLTRSFNHFSYALKSMTKDYNHKMAVLIDGENMESTLITSFVLEASLYGDLTVKRVYGDWTNPSMKSWKDQLNAHAFKPIQKFEYTKGKGSTDTALIIDAMDLLHAGKVNGFCIISSDSDYTGLAHRIREEGLFVMGIGKAHTPDAFKKACKVFVSSESNFGSSAKSASPRGRGVSTSKKATTAGPSNNPQEKANSTKTSSSKRKKQQGGQERKANLTSSLLPPKVSSISQQKLRHGDEQLKSNMNATTSTWQQLEKLDDQSWKNATNIAS